MNKQFFAVIIIVVVTVMFTSCQKDIIYEEPEVKVGEMVTMFEFGNKQVSALDIERSFSDLSPDEIKVESFPEMVLKSADDKPLPQFYFISVYHGPKSIYRIMWRYSEQLLLVLPNHVNREHLESIRYTNVKMGDTSFDYGEWINLGTPKIAPFKNAAAYTQEDVLKIGVNEIEGEWNLAEVYFNESYLADWYMLHLYHKTGKEYYSRNSLGIGELNPIYQN